MVLDTFHNQQKQQQRRRIIVITVAGFDETKLVNVLTEKGLPSAKTPAQPNRPMVIAILFAMVVLATMVYGPLGALLVELSPVRTRYSGVSVALQLGNGWIGGFASFVATAVVVATGKIFGRLVHGGACRPDGDRRCAVVAGNSWPRHQRLIGCDLRHVGVNVWRRGVVVRAGRGCRRVADGFVVVGNGLVGCYQHGDKE